MTLASGVKLGPYEIVAPLGAGGMGEVYRARDSRLARMVAIKILPAHLSHDLEAKERFDREARAISSLNHPNICHLYDVGVQDGTSYLVLEYLEGETLADRLRKGPLPLDQFLKIGIEICEGLEKAHRSGVLHRDLKPGNTMLTKNGTKLMDFGLAKAMPALPAIPSLTASLDSPAASSPLTAQGTVVGTFQYMAREQLAGHEADVRSDLFSLGAVLYEMFTGKRAFEGKSTLSVASAILEKEPPPINSIKPMILPALDHAMRIVHAQTHEPAKQQVVIDLLDQQTFRTNGEEHLQQQPPQDILRGNRRSPRVSVQRVELRAQRPQYRVGHLPHFAQRMIRRHTLLQCHIAEHPVPENAHLHACPLRRIKITKRRTTEPISTNS
jgi:serine/threonine protein kinase